MFIWGTENFLCSWRLESLLSHDLKKQRIQGELTFLPSVHGLDRAQGASASDCGRDEDMQAAPASAELPALRAAPRDPNARIC